MKLNSKLILLLFSLSLLNAQVKDEIYLPKLAVVIVVDQMRYDYLIRYAGYFNHGFAKLINDGAYFTEASHDHAFTSTAAGHATISTGTFPSKHGIVLNNYYEHSSKKFVYSCGDSTAKILGIPDKEGISPLRLMRNGISDWLKKSNKESKVFCVSLKDRPSVMMGGKNPNGVFWYDDDSGSYVTSEYYMKSYPEWVESFNKSGIVFKHYNDDWVKLLNEDDYLISREDDFPFENTRVGRTFPHKLKKSEGDTVSFLEKLPYSPFGEELNFDFTKTIIENENLGKDNNTDLLFIGCSSGDKLGHDFDPLSQEMQDYYVRLDIYIGDFINYLDANIGKDNYVIAVSADHGSASISEDLQRRGYDSKRVHSEEVEKEYFKSAEKVQNMFGLKNTIIELKASSGFVLDYNEAKGKNIAPEILRKSFAEELKKIYFVEETYTIDEINNGGNKIYLSNYQKNYYPGRSYEVFVLPKKYYTHNHDDYGVNHGTPYEYDSHVPIIFYGSGIKAGKNNKRISTVDIAPTLAEILKIKYDEDVDGKSLVNIIKK